MGDLDDVSSYMDQDILCIALAPYSSGTISEVHSG